MLLVYVMKYNIVANLKKFAEIAKAMGAPVEGLSVREAAERAIVAMGTLSCDLGIPERLKEVGVTPADIPALAAEASQIDRLLNNNPRWLTVKEIEQIYRDALGE
jgi:alcohol dehydrogenase class IV